MASLTHRLAVSLLQVSNRLLPAPALPGDVEDLDYAQWEFDTSETALRLFQHANGRVDRVLDIGCGLGGKTMRLVESTSEDTLWFGLDIDAAHLRAAAAFERHRGHHSRVRWLAGDAARLPFPDASIDRIISADALEHFPQPRAALLEMRRCLRPDGRLILLFNPWLSPRGSHLADVLHLPWCQAFFSRATLAEATRRIVDRSARACEDERAALRLRLNGEELVEHFEHHLFRTTIADLRRWLIEDRSFDIVHEQRVGPGPTARWQWFPPRFLEEWWSATYGAVLAPRRSSGREAT